MEGFSNDDCEQAPWGVAAGSSQGILPSCAQCTLFRTKTKQQNMVERWL